MTLINCCIYIIVPLGDEQQAWSKHAEVNYRNKFKVNSWFLGESNGKIPLRTCPECSVPEPYRSPEWALVPAKTGLRAEN
jgi:hypothetical protein